MRKLVFLFFAVLSITSAKSQFLAESAKQIFSIPRLKDSLAKHKIVAILPFSTTVSYKRMPKNFNPEMARDEEKKLAINMQQGMYTYLMRKREKYTVSFQDVEKTNILLKQAGLYEKWDEVLPDSLAKVLGVDAVIKCNYAYEKTGSEAGAIVGAILLGGAGGKTGSGALKMQINDGKSGELLWRFYKEMNEGVMSNANEVMERMMRKVSRNFPYEK